MLTPRLRLGLGRIHPEQERPMSRETKLGLVVAGAFVSLLAAVVHFRLQDGDGPKPETPVVVRTEGKPPAPTKKAVPPEPREIDKAVFQKVVADPPKQLPPMVTGANEGRPNTTVP